MGLRLCALAIAGASAYADGFLRSQPVTGVCEDTAAQESGYFDIAAGTKHYFYYLAEARNSPDTAPVVLWQTGGPGCSSLLAAFTENGPCLVPETGPNAGKVSSRTQPPIAPEKRATKKYPNTQP